MKKKLHEGNLAENALGTLGNAKSEDGERNEKYFIFIRSISGLNDPNKALRPKARGKKIRRNGKEGIWHQVIFTKCGE